MATSPLTILLVDHDEMERQAIHHMLQPHYNLYGVATETQAHAFLQFGSPDCVLFTQQLPAVDALDFLAECSQGYIPVIVLTSVGSEAMAVEAMKRGAQDYLVKSSLTQELLGRAIQNAVEKVALQRQLRMKEEALRESEMRYRTLVEGSIQGIAIVDHNALCVFANQALATMFGYPSIDSLLGCNLLTTIVGPEHRELIDVYRRARLRGESAATHYEFRGCRYDGTLFWVEVVASLILWQGRQAILATFADISARKQMEEEVLRIRKIESVGVLAAGIAHDFNNLLSGILGNISLAKALARSPDRMIKQLEIAEKACQQATALTSQLLTFSKGGMPVRRVISLTDLLRESLEFSLHGSNVRSSINIEPHLWSVDADKDQLYQVIHNIVLNALQAMPLGGNLEVTAENTFLQEEDSLPVPTGAYVRITVQDEGCGIPEEVLPNIFDPYFTTKEHGNGLGLAITHSIVSKHQGCITVASTVGKGTAMRIYLPAVEPSLPASATASEPPPVQRAKILVMDDEELIRDLLKDILSYLGYDVLCTSNGQEAIRAYEQALAIRQPFAAVILDITVPGGMGGKETLPALQALDPQVKALLSSGYANDPVIANYQQYGFSGVVPKPYNMQQLSEALENILG